MKITDNAIEAILKTMEENNLDPKKVYFEMRAMPDQSIMIGFNREVMGKVLSFGKLNMIISTQIDTTGILVDYVESEEKKGLVFKEEK